MTHNIFSSPARAGVGRQQKKHVAVSLHPVSLMTMLCAGVFLVAATISVFGASYEVTASVPGPIPTSPAIISSPTDGQHFTSADTTFSGSCPAATYVTLFINGSTAGSSWCSTGLTFSILTTLPAGTSTAQVQDYNSLNQPGPTSGVITVYYDPPVPPPAPGPVPTPTPAPSPSPAPAPAAPIELRVADVDTNMDYKTINGVPLTTQNPTFFGTAPPFSKIKIEIHSDPVFCYTTTTSTGYWKCRVATKLPPGIHTVAVSAITVEGKNLRIPIFKILVIEDPQPAPIIAAPTPLAIVLPTYSYQVYSVGQAVPLNFNITGGSAPYTITVDWRDGRRTTIVQQTSGPVSLSHRYAAGNRELMSYEALIRLTDANGNSVVSQIPILVRGYVVPALGTTQKPPSTFQQFITNMHNWLWLLWPGYLVVALMLFSFYLGERREHDEDRKALLRRTHALIKPNRHHHA